MTSPKCRLCASNTKLCYTIKTRNYFQCDYCHSMMLDPLWYVSKEAEKARYKTHNNDVNDSRYQAFVSPIVEGVQAHYNAKHIGLDYGAGTGPVITSLLEKEGYCINLYDPYFHHYPNNLLKSYDYIICCEVMEHFNHPYDEFKKLSSILHANGRIFCMTKLYDESIDFENWNYKNDQTHVFFYHKKAIQWIKKEFGFSQVSIEGRLITFLK